MEQSLGSVLPGGQNTHHLGDRAGQIQRQLQTAYRNAAAWLGQRRVWATRAPMAKESAAAMLAEELKTVRREVLARTGMRVGIGAARTATVARTASRVEMEGGVCVVAGGEERDFLAPLPLQKLYGLSGASLRVLRASGLVTIGELQRVPKAALQAGFGDAEGLRIWRSARGLDTTRDGGRASLSDALRPGLGGNLLAGCGTLLSGILRKMAF
jgi:DNA polymerase IV